MGQTHADHDFNGVEQNERSDARKESGHGAHSCNSHKLRPATHVRNREESECAALELLPLTPGDDVYLLYGVDGTPLAFRVREKLKEKLLAKEVAQ